MAWKTPYRPNKEISQTYNSGMVRICEVQNTALPGYRPKEELVEKIKLPYEEQRLGIQRYYAGKQNQLEIERVLRVPFSRLITSQDVAITEDRRQYRIDLIQTVDGVFPPSGDLTLVRFTQNVFDSDTAGEEEGNG